MSDECSVCLGAYDKDIKDGELLKEWIQGTDSKCAVWMHVECLDKSGKNYVCPFLWNLFLLRMSVFWNLHLHGTAIKKKNYFGYDNNKGLNGTGIAQKAFFTEQGTIKVDVVDFL